MANSDTILLNFPNIDASDVQLDAKTKSLAPNSETKGAYGGNGSEYLLNGDIVEPKKPKDGDFTKDKVSNTKKLGYQNSAYNTKMGSYGKGAYSYGYYPQAYQYPRYGYNGSSYASAKTNPYYQYLTQHNGKSGGTGQSYGYMDSIYANYGMYGAYMNSLGAGYGYGSYGYDAWKHMPNWYAVNKTGSYGYHHGYGKENIEGLNEMNRGPRATKGFKSQEGSKVLSVSTKGQIVSEKPKEDGSLPDPKEYNRKDFPESYSEAKIFVIKSYSEDDIHKSIKYGVWSSTPNGNKKLDASYNEAKQKSDNCPVFLLFSVNTSGQFVGLAEMVGPVDFNKTVEYWQQDKWIGCFPVKWHIVKDIPNSSLRHITLEYNENKPVTNSRDTQEVKLEQGNKVIKIFKDYASKTCILDDFVFYENRQKSIQEGKIKQLQFKKQALVANEKKVINGGLVSKTKGEDATATEATIESKVKENDSDVAAANGVAPAC
ncbi:unnamed protein product [Cochlearia groenlandica]